jgi:spore coat polysaccharide biosynthesis protein SpsF
MMKKPGKSAIFIAVRMKSTRLPRKALLEIKGRTVIEHLIDRLKTAKRPEVIVLCTSTHPDDAILADVAQKNGIKAFRGSEDDKLERFLGAAAKYGIDYMAAVDGDDILCDPVYIDKTIEMLISTGADMVKCDKLPLGTACNGLKIEALNKVCQMKAESDTEVWGGYFTDNRIFKVVDLVPDDPELVRPDIRLTLDYPEDFRVFEEIFNRLYVPGSVFSLKEIIALFNRHPELLEINKQVHEQYLKGIEKKVQKIRLKGAGKR